MHTKISDLQRQLVEICYNLIFVYNSTNPQTKIVYEWSKLSDNSEETFEVWEKMWDSKIKEIKDLSDFTINRIIVNDIPKNYFDLWMKSKFDYLNWARDLN
jgi:hypothetical protein